MSKKYVEIHIIGAIRASLASACTERCDASGGGSRSLCAIQHVIGVGINRNNQ